MRAISIPLLAVGASVLMGGCVTTGTYSALSGTPVTRSDPSLFPVRVVAIDRKLEIGWTSADLTIEPGQREITFDVSLNKKPKPGDQRTVVVNIEPRARYVFAAKRDPASPREWALVLDRKEPIEGCTVGSPARRSSIGLSPGAAVAS